MGSTVHYRHFDPEDSGEKSSEMLLALVGIVMPSTFCLPNPTGSFVLNLQKLICQPLIFYPYQRISTILFPQFQN